MEDSKPTAKTTFHKLFFMLEILQYPFATFTEVYFYDCLDLSYSVYTVFDLSQATEAQCLQENPFNCKWTWHFY